MTFEVVVAPTAQDEIKRLPARFRHRLRRAITELATEPRPPRSEPLDYPLPAAEPRRLRLEGWRVVYAIVEAQAIVAVVAVRRRPPYDYDDLPDLFADLS